MEHGAANPKSKIQNPKYFTLHPSSFILALLLWWAVPAVGAEWFSRDFQYRRMVAVEESSPGTPACYVRFSHPGALAKDGRDVRVINSAGKRVEHEVLRIGPGDEVELLFECLGAKQGTMYAVYFGNPTAVEAKPWKAPAGVVLEVRRRANGDCKSWNEYKKMFDDSKELLGRTLRSKIFEGYNPLGPNENFVSYYRASFHAAVAGTYKFATNSEKASFLFVNGKPVAQFPGWHNGWDGRFGQHSGTVELGAGTHLLEYYHAQSQGETIAVAAWQRPGEKELRVMEDNCFVPVARARAKTLERADGHPALDFEWTPQDHVMVDWRYIVRYVFEARANASGTITWDFGDGTSVKVDTRESLKIKHGFITPGTYTVTLSPPATSSYAPVKQTVVIEPVWRQREDFDEGRWKEYRSALLTRLAEQAVRGADIGTLVTYAKELKDKELLVASAAQAWKVSKDIPAAAHGRVFLTLSLEVQSQLKDYLQADRAFVEAINGPGDTHPKERAKLHRAGLLIHVLGKVKDGLDILKTVRDSDLDPPNEPVLKQIYLADAYAALGNREEAIRRYENLRTVVPLTDRSYAVGRRSRLLCIGAYIRRGDYESALLELNNIEWETPQERMGDDTGILRAECHLGEKDYQRAVLLLDRLLKLNSSSPRAPELLLLLIKAHQGMQRDDLAGDTYARMKKEQPYAAETALAAALFKK